MKKTLLQIVQDILNDMDSDEVNSIDDTVESQQVASIVRQCYEEIIGNRDWPHLKKITNLDSVVDITRPTHFRVPENLKEMVEFKYDCQRLSDQGRVMYREMDFLFPDEFLKLVHQRDNTRDDTQTVTLHGGVKLFVLNNQPPQYWTTFDDDYIVLDAYQADIENTLMASKSIITAYFEPTWNHLDDAVPDLPTEAFAMLTEEAKSTAFSALKQMANQKAEQKAQRQQRWLSRKAWRVHGGVRYSNFGRRSAK